MRATLQDVAQKAGVSTATVSFTLRGHKKAKSYKPATRARILAAAEELHYRKDFFASQLRSSRRQMLMMFLPSLSDPIAARIGESFERQAAELGYRTMVTVVDQATRGGEAHEIVGQHGVKAVAVISAAADLLHKKTFVEWAENGVHVVLVGRESDQRNISWVSADSRDGIREMAGYLYENGAKDIWIFKPRGVKGRHVRKCDAFEDYARQNNYPLPKIVDVPPMEVTGEGFEETLQFLHSCLQSNPLPQAIYAWNDLRACLLIRVLQEMGVHVGKDIAVFGHDGVTMSMLTSPPLATVHLPLVEMGSSAAKMLIDLAGEKIRPGRRLMLSTELLVRESAGLPTIHTNDTVTNSSGE